MRNIIIRAIVIFCAFTLVLNGAAKFKQTGKWILEGDINGQAAPTMVDKDGHIVGAFYKTGARVLTPEKSIELAPYGQGPSDLQGFRAICDYKGDIAIHEIPGKVKVFSKKKGAYSWKETVWLKRTPLFHVVQNMIFYHNKWFLAGVIHLERNKDQRVPCAYVKVLDEKGNFLKDLVKSEIDTKIRHYAMDYYIVGCKNHVLFLPENKLSLTVISPEDLKIEKSIDLEKPSFYKKMPEDFYLFKKYEKSGQFDIDMENWKVGYSRITRVTVEDNYIVVQVRTCRDSMKKFALLFYNIDTFKLEHTFFIDDFLLSSRNGKYYFFANGNPGLDEEAEETVINIYEWKN